MATKETKAEKMVRMIIDFRQSQRDFIEKEAGELDPPSMSRYVRLLVDKEMKRKSKLK